MKYLIVFIISIIIGIFVFIFWKKYYSKYLPYEDSGLLKFIVCIVICMVSIVSGLCVSSANQYAIIFGITIFTITLIIVSILGFYYKIIATKKW